MVDDQIWCHWGLFFSLPTAAAPLPMLLQEGTGRYFRFRSRPWRGTPFSHYRMQARTLTDFTDENEYSKVQQIPWASRKSASRHHRRHRRFTLPTGMRQNYGCRQARTSKGGGGGCGCGSEQGSTFTSSVTRGGILHQICNNYFVS